MELDIFGQQPDLSNLYTQICFCYSLPPTTSRSVIIQTLNNGLKTLSTSFPWIAGQVINENCIYKIIPLHTIPLLVSKDLTQDPTAPTMHDLRKARFPSHMLDENIIAPIKTLAAGSKEVAESSPAFVVQITFIKDGVLVTIVSQHNIMDMTGQGEIMRLLDKACNGIPFTEEEIRIGNLERRGLVSLLGDEYQPGPEVDMQISSAAEKPPSNHGPGTESAETPPPRKCSWAYFTFSYSSLTALKALAISTLSSGTSYISTDDALTAYIWQSLTRARLSRLSSTTKTTLARAVDPRRYLAIPETYTGLVQNMVYETSSMGSLIDEPLGCIAERLRGAVDVKTSGIGYNTRALATLFDRSRKIANSDDNKSVGVTVNVNPSTDIMLSSWSKVDCYNMDFHLGLGKPERVSRPRFEPVESLIYFMPRDAEGGVAVTVCAREGDLEGLKEGGFGRFVG